MGGKRSRFRREARLNIREKKPEEVAEAPCCKQINLTIDLYGPKHKASAMGKFLGQHQIFLRPPFMVDPEYEVRNFHQSKPKSLSLFTTGGRKSRTTERLRKFAVISLKYLIPFRNPKTCPKWSVVS